MYYILLVQIVYIKLWDNQHVLLLPINKQKTVYCRKSLSNIPCSLKGFMASRYVVRKSLRCALFSECLQIRCYSSWGETAPFTGKAEQRGATWLYRKAPLSNRERITHKSNNRHFPTVPSPPYVPVTPGMTEEGSWCDCSVSLQPALRSRLVVTPFPRLQACPPHFGRLEFHTCLYEVSCGGAPLPLIPQILRFSRRP